MSAGLGSLGLPAMALKFVPYHISRGEHDLVRTLIRRSTTRLLALSVFIYLLLVGIVVAFEDLNPILSRYRKEILLYGTMIPVSVLSFQLNQILRGFLDIRYIVMSGSFLQLSAKVGLAVVAFEAGMGLNGYLSAVLGSALLALGVLAIGVRRHLSHLPSAPHASGDEEARWRDYAKLMYSVHFSTFYSPDWISSYWLPCSDPSALASMQRLSELHPCFETFST